MSYNTNVDGYAIEATEGTSVITAAGDTAYKIGLMPSKTRCDMPDPSFETLQLPAATNAKEPADGGLWKTTATLRGALMFNVQNGIFLFLTMGKSATVGADPYTHTITPTTDGSLIPSITWQHEESGGGTAEQYQYRGVKVDSLTLVQNRVGSDPLQAKLEVQAMTVADPAFSLTTPPALPATANTGPYITLTRNWDTAGTNTSIAGLKKIEISVLNGLEPVRDGAWPYLFTESDCKEYIIKLDYHPNTIERELWDDAKATGTATKTAVFKWTRSANDYIQLTASDCAVLHNSKHSELSGDLKIEQCIIKPRALSWEVKDSIVGGRYGE